MRLRFQSFYVAGRGIVHAIATESHFQVHIAISVVVIALAVCLRASVDDWCWFVGCMGAVMSAECFNTSIERLGDRVSLEHHPLIRDAKDVSAGAVLIVVLASVVIGILRFWPLASHFLNQT
jgi:diacylglycerol kinase